MSKQPFLYQQLSIKVVKMIKRTIKKLKRSHAFLECLLTLACPSGAFSSQAITLNSNIF